MTAISGPTPTLAHRSLVSAHRAAAAQSGVEDNTWEALEAAVATGVDFVEVDVHRTADGQYVLIHDAVVCLAGRSTRVADLTAREVETALGRPLVRYADALDLIAAWGKGAHIDFKFTSPPQSYASPRTTWEAEAADIAWNVMGSTDRFCLTTMEDCSVAALAVWAAEVAPGTRVGLSLGRDIFHLNPITALRVRLSELFPARRLRRCGANLLVCNYRLADARLLRWAWNHQMPVLVWTVDSAAPLARYVRDPRVWMVTSNHPGRVLADLDAPTTANYDARCLPADLHAA